jgi:hypothetical protein
MFAFRKLGRLVRRGRGSFKGTDPSRKSEKSQNRPYLGRVSNREPFEYKSETLPLEAACSVIVIHTYPDASQCCVTPSFFNVITPTGQEKDFIF